MAELIKYYFLFMLIFGLSISLSAQNRAQICMDKNSSFLYQPYPDLLAKPIIIELKEWKLKANDTFYLTPSFENEDSTKIIGVFSKDSLLLLHYLLNRVPSAINLGQGFYTSKALFSQESTDIEEDFSIDNQLIVVPKEARYLFLGNSDLVFDQSEDSICLNVNFTSSAREFEVKAIAKVKVAKCRIKVLLWDDSNEDGDIVSLYLNGKKIVNRYKVINKRHKIRLDLQSGRNEFWIYAENTGKLGDNTAVLQIYAAPYRRVIHVNSKAGTAKNIVIICEE